MGVLSSVFLAPAMTFVTSFRVKGFVSVDNTRCLSYHWIRSRQTVSAQFSCLDRAYLTFPVTGEFLPHWMDREPSETMLLIGQRFLDT